MAGNAGLQSPLQQKYGLGRIDPSRVGQVWVGQAYPEYTGGTPTAGYGPKQDKYVPFDVAAASFYSLSPAAQKAMYRNAQEYYGLDVVPESYMNGFMENMSNAAYQIQQTTGLKIGSLEAWDFIKSKRGKALGLRDSAGESGGGGGGGAGAYMGPTTSVTEQVQLTNPSTARGLVEDAIGKYLGRRPDKKEYANFMQALSAYEEESPYVTTSRTERTISSSATKSKTMGGVSPTQFAEEFARSQEGAAELQVATTAYDALIGLLSGQ